MLKKDEKHGIYDQFNEIHGNADSVSFVKKKKDKSKVVNIAIPVDFYYLQSSAIDQVRDKLSNQEFKDTCEKDDSEKKAKCLKYVSSTFCKVFQSCYLYFEFIKILN